jgi:hypothetical protein
MENQKFLSTKGLMELHLLSTISSIDGTHKLIYEGYPIIVTGIIDQSKAFHPTMFCFSTSEDCRGFGFAFIACRDYLKDVLNFEFLPKSLVADNAHAITNGFEKAFNHKYVRINCWAHSERNMEDEMKKINVDKEARSELLDDIRRLQICKTKSTFLIAIDFFYKKWEDHTGHNVQVFLDYFKLEKMSVCPNRYEAVAECVPSHSNAIESCNRYIKEDETFREQWPIGRFQTKSLEIVSNWSKERKPEDNVNCKLFHHHPVLTTKVWKNAYSYIKFEKPEILQINNSITTGYTSYFVKSAQSEAYPLNKTSIANYKRALKSPPGFDLKEFFELEFRYWEIRVSNGVTEDNWNQKQIFCNCPSFQKNFVCKHTIGVAIRLKLSTVPDPAKNSATPIGARKALERMTQN